MSPIVQFTDCILAAKLPDVGDSKVHCLERIYTVIPGPLSWFLYATMLDPILVHIILSRSTPPQHHNLIKLKPMTLIYGSWNSQKIPGLRWESNPHLHNSGVMLYQLSY